MDTAKFNLLGYLPAKKYISVASLAHDFLQHRHTDPTTK